MCSIVQARVVFVLAVLGAHGAFGSLDEPISFLSGKCSNIPLETKRQGLFSQTSVESFLDNTLEQETTVSPECVQDGSR